jgi:hypothetical protein
MFYDVIVTNKDHGLGTESNFDFKYIPNFDTETNMGDYVAGLRSSGLERRNFGALLVFSAAVGLASFAGLKTGWSLLGNMRLQRPWFT